MTDTPDLPEIPVFNNTNTTDNTVVATYDGRNIEELIGFVEEEYPCSYSGVNGTLYAGTDGLAFLGKFFLFDKKMFVKWVDVKVQQTDQGVAVQMRADEPVIHEFMGIQKPERVWSTLVSLHNNALLDRTRSPATADGTLADASLQDGGATARRRAATAQPIHRRQLRRMTSDPSKLAPAIEALFAGAGRENLMMDASEKPVTKKESKPAGAGGDEVKDGTSTATTTKGNLTKDTQAVLAASQVSDIEVIVGKVQGEFCCLYNGQKGTLHAGSTALYFAGERLFFPARLTIQSNHIRQVKMIKGKPKSDVTIDETKQQSTEDIIKEQGIVIWTHEGVSHTFLGMESPDQVWASLVALRNHVSVAHNSPRSFGMRRMNSDPNLQSKTGMQLIQTTTTTTHVMRDGRGDGTTTAERATTVEKELAPPVLTEEELKEAWSRVMDKKNRYTTSVVKDHEFACTLDRFFKQYVGDDAEFNIGNFMESKIGDKDLKTSPWKPSEQDGKLVRKRVVRYVHPVNAPMAPPEAAARKEQTYQRFGDYGFTVETKTFVVGVPMADCFFVKDRVIVANKEQGPTKGGKVLMSMEFELEFVKSTMFRGIITKTTNAEVSKFLELRRDYMAESLGEEVIPPKEEEQAEKEVVVEESGLFPGSLTMTSITHGLLLFVILLQFWILLEMHSMKRTMQRIESVDYRQQICSDSNR